MQTEPKTDRQAPGSPPYRSQPADQVSLSQTPPQPLSTDPDAAASDLDYERFLDYMRVIRQNTQRMREKLQEEQDPIQPIPAAIPSVVGLPLDRAVNKLKLHTLKAEEIRLAYNPTTPTGHVVYQTPAPGPNRTRSRALLLVVSRGTPPDQEQTSLFSKEAPPESQGHYDQVQIRGESAPPTQPILYGKPPPPRK